MNAKSNEDTWREVVVTHGVLSKNPEDLFYGKGWRVAVAVLKEAFLRLLSDDAFGMAGNVAFRALLAIFPFLIFTSALTAFVGDSSMANKLIDFLIAIVPPPLIEPIVSEVLQVMTVPRGDVLSVGILLTIWFAIGGVDGVRIGLNRAYGVRETRSLFVLYAIEIAMVILASMAFVVVGYLLVLAPEAGSWLHMLLPGFDPAAVTVRLVRFPASATIFVVALFAAHVLLPARRTRFANIWPGVVFTAAAWTVLASAFSYYVVSFGTYASYYAGMAGIVAALYFMYLSALLLIFGGELNRALRIRRLASILNN